MPYDRYVSTGAAAFVAGLVALATCTLAGAAGPDATPAADAVHPQWRNTLRPAGTPGLELHLAENGAAPYRIVLPAGAEGSEKLAAEKLGAYLGRMAGAAFALVEETDDFQPTGREISVGRTRLLARADPPQLRADLGEDGYAVAVQGTQLFVFGRTPGGTLNGVYCLLEEDLGCRWYSKLYEPLIPQRPSLRFRPVPRAYRPVLEHVREVYYSDAHGDAEWSRANRIETMSSVGTAWGFAHTYNRLLPPGRYFQENPDYYSEIGGKRTPRQLCMSHPDVERIILEQLLDHHEANPHVRFYEISPNDGRGYCECPKCKAIDDAAGGTAMGALLRTLNRIAGEVEKVYPEVRITTLAYLGTFRPPVNERPHRNIIITLATDSSTWSWPHLPVTETPTMAGPDRPAFRSALRAWHEAGADIRIWDYTIVFQYTMRPIPNVAVVADNLRYYVRYGATGVFLQGHHNANDGCDRSLMRSWVWSKQLWDPSRDTRELVRDFNFGFYGPAAEPMQAYDDLLGRLWDRHHMNFLQDGQAKMLYDMLFTTPVLVEAFGLMDEAERLAGSDRDLLGRIRLAKLPLQYLALNRGPGDDPAGYRRMLAQFKHTTQSGASCWRYPWAGRPGCGPAGDTGAPNDDYDHVPLATHPWQNAGTGTDIVLTGHDGLSLKDLIDQWSGPRNANAGIIIKADPASEAAVRQAFGWASSERETVAHRPALTIDYTPAGGGDRRRIVFRQGADNALVADYQGCEDNMLVQTQPGNNQGSYQTCAAGSIPWSNRNNPVRSVMRWDLSALAGRYADIHAVTLSLYDDSSHTSGTAYVYAIKAANAGWPEGGTKLEIRYLENNLVSPADRDRIIDLWQRLADGEIPGKDEGVGAVALGPSWRFRYDTTGGGEQSRWHEPDFVDDDWAEIRPGDRLSADEPGWAWLRTRVAVPRDFPRNLNTILYVPGARGNVVLYIEGRKDSGDSGLGFERTARATGLSPAELADAPLDLAVFRGLAPGDTATIAIRMSCPGGLETTWRPAHLVSVPTRLAGPALQQVVAGLEQLGLVQPGVPKPPAPIEGALSLPKTWTVFGPLNSQDPVPPTDALRSLPTVLAIAGRTLEPQAMTAEDHRLDLVAMLGASAGRTAFVFIPFDLDAGQNVTFGIGADWWFESWVDGEPLMDTLEHGNVDWPPAPDDYVKTVHLGPGPHVLAIRFLSGSGSSVLAVAGPDGLRGGGEQ